MKKRHFLPLLSCTLLFSFLTCKEASKKAIETVAVTFEKEGELSVFRTGTDSLMARLDIEIADTEYETQTGLMYRDAMEPNQGMLFVFENEALHSFYMKNTKIPLDLIFIRANMKVGHIIQNAQPLNESGLSSRVPVQYVLEVNAGATAKWGFQEGDSIAYQRHQ